MSKHTPGPWSYKDNGHYFDVGVIEDGHDMVYPAVCIGVMKYDEANARLITAAPDLLAALDMILEYIERRKRYSDIEHYSEIDRNYETMVADAKAAIKKARGE